MRRSALLPLYLLGLLTLICMPFIQPHTGMVATSQAAGPSYPIMFVTQVPMRQDFTTVVSTFGNHLGSLNSAPRGGGLWMRYTNGVLKNLTQAAGYGSSDAFQGPEAIAVRDPSIHWSGTKALFSMVIGAPSQRYQVQQYYWQIYEISGLGESDTPVITKVSNQPSGYNNITPIYASDDQIIFTTDRARNGQAHLSPQLDEYELAPTVSGLWKLNPTSGALLLLNHAPSGNFTPVIDSYGRVIFTQWDHLQRDQQADADAMNTGNYGTFDYSNETAQATRLNSRTEIFPEPRASRTDLLAGTNLVGHNFNHFFPWQILEDGTESEILNHLGRHELHSYIPASITGDANVFDYYGQISRYNTRPILNMFQIREAPATAGRYYGIDAPEFGTHAAGQVIAIDAPPNQNPDQIQVQYITHRETATADDTPSANHSGLYRDPLPLSDGTLIASHTSETRQDGGTGGPNISRYDFKLKPLTLSGNGHYVAGASLTGGINTSITYWSPDESISYTGPLWELQPVEVRARLKPTQPVVPLNPAVAQAIQQAGVDQSALQIYLRQNNLALVVTQNVTTRDDFDDQQPFNLRVPGGITTSSGTGTVYDVSFLQFFQGQQLRGWTGSGVNPRPGRRILARTMVDITGLHATNGSPAGSVAIFPDGSTAAFVPAGRATSWQLTDAGGTGIVRERYWLTFQAGEIRSCGSCHGQNTLNQAGQPPPTNTPQALIALLQEWKETGGVPQLSQIYLPVARR
jgi:hypothetical protein